MTSVATRRTVRAEAVMGTVVSFDVRDRGAAVDVAIDRAVALLHEADATYSTYRETSAVQRIARGQLALHDANPEVQSVLERCEMLRRETGGYFSMWATGALDPSGLVKGWAVQRAADVLSRAGLEHFCVTGGGDITCRGGAWPETGWRVGIQHPLDPDALAAVIRVTDCAIATSGAYARGQHVADPHTGRAPVGVLSVTIIGPDLATADAYATAAFAMGLAGPDWAASLPEHESMTVLADHSVLSTPGFPFAESRP